MENSLYIQKLGVESMEAEKTMNIKSSEGTSERKTRKRWIALVLIYLVFVLAYFDRANISVATSTIINDLNITAVQMGLATSLFSLAYAITQIPGALLARKFGTKKVVFYAVVLWSIFTLLTGVVTGLASLMLVRIMFGIAEGPISPTSNTFVYHWFPVKERGFANSVSVAGSYSAPIFAPPIVVFLIQEFGWRSVFFISGIIGIILAIVWIFVIRSRPENHPSISKSELNYIKAGQVNEQLKEQKVPWKKLFLSRSFWGIGLSFFVTLYVIQFYLYWLPFYLENQLKMSIESMGYASSMPWVFILFAVLFAGRLSDSLIKANKTRFVARNLPMMFGFGLAALTLYFSSLLSSPWIIVIFMSVALGFAGVTISIPWAIASDIAGQFTGIVAAWMNMWGFLGATIMPYASALIGEKIGWDFNIIIMIIMSVLGVIFIGLVKTDRKITA